MICEECKKENTTSKIVVKVRRFCGDSGLVFWDELGEKHVHPEFKTISRYYCTNGHSWIEKSYSECHCGWTSNE